MPPERATVAVTPASVEESQRRHSAGNNADISLPLDDKEARLQYEIRSPTEDGNSSVQRLLVMSTDAYAYAYMVDPSDVRDRLSAWWDRPGHGLTTWPTWGRPNWARPNWARMAAKVKTHSDSWRENYQIPYLILVLGVVQVTLHTSPLEPFSSEQLMWAGRTVGKSEPWRFLSYVLPHTGTAHLALNVLVQTLVGVPAETAQGTLRVAAIYVGGALSGALATAVLCPTLQMVGSSAAIYAVLTAHLADVFLNKEWIFHPNARAGAVLILAIADVAYTVCHTLLYGNQSPRIGLAAHVAGAVAGLPLGLSIYRRGPQKSSLPRLTMTSSPSATRERIVKATRVVSALVLGICAAAGIAFLVAVPRPSPSDPGQDYCSLPDFFPP